jgi:hypothetical protein
MAQNSGPLGYLPIQPLRSDVTPLEIAVKDDEKSANARRSCRRHAPSSIPLPLVKGPGGPSPVCSSRLQSSHAAPTFGGFVRSVATRGDRNAF